MEPIRITVLLGIVSLIACTRQENRFDASGTFEAREVIVSAEVMGKILSFDAREGDLLNEGQVVVQIDSTALALQKAQVQASIASLTDKRSEAKPQLSVLEKQLANQEANIDTYRAQLEVLEKEQRRVKKLYESEAATGQQLDEINGKVDVLKKQITAAVDQKATIRAQMNAHVATVAIQNRGVTSGRLPLEKQIDLIEDQLRRTSVTNPVQGTLLSKYTETGEYVSPGKALYKVADLSEMTLRAYVDGTQLAQIRLGQPVEVYVDQDADNYKKYSGTINWISDKAEFTPKTIQTKNERANLVYAIKVGVPNDGYLKIGMYGEINFEAQNAEE